MWQKNCIIAAAVICLLAFLSTVAILFFVGANFCLSSANCTAIGVVSVQEPITLLTTTTLPSLSTRKSIIVPKSIWQNVRLPKSITPSIQKLLIQPFVDDGYFLGNTTISFRLEENLSAILIHAKYLNFSSWNLFRKENESEHIRVHVGRAFFVERSDYFVLQAYDTEFPAGEYLIHIDYVGSLERTHYGFYRSRIAAGDSDQLRYCRWLCGK